MAIQLAGPRYADRRLLALAGWIEERRGTEPDWPLVPRTTPADVWKEA